MENEKENYLIESILPDNAFKEEYASQNLSENREFRNWKNKMIQKYGKNAKLFECLKDNIIFYTSNEDFKSYPYYKSKCPCCKQFICYYCHSIWQDNIYGNGSCCLSRKINYMIFKDSLQLIDPYDKKIDCSKICKNKYLYFLLIPVLHLLFFIYTIHMQFLYGLNLKNNVNHCRYYEERYTDNGFTFEILIGIDIAFSIILTFSYFLLNLYFIIILLVISIPFKFYPMVYYMGMAFWFLEE